MENSLITSFFDVLAYVLYGIHRVASFNINVGLKHLGENWIVWNNPPVVNFNLSVVHIDVCEATIPMSPPSVEWVAIFPCLSFPDECLRVLFGAFSIRHAGGFIVQVATWSTNHMPFDDIEQQGIWKFDTDDLVNVSGLYLLL